MSDFTPQGDINLREVYKILGLATPTLDTDAANKKYVDDNIVSGAVAADHGTATTDQIVNVSYGTSATPPTASTTTEGSIYLQYTN